MPPDESRSIASWTLATVAMWSDKCPDACHELMSRHFDYLEFYEDGISVINGFHKGGHPNIKHIPKAQDHKITPEVAKNVMEAVNAMRDDDIKFHVSGEHLDKLPGITRTGNAADDSTAVATRIDSLERSQERLVDFLREELAKIKNEIQVRQSVPAPAPVVRAPAVQVNGAPAPSSFSQLGARPKVYNQRGPSRKRAKSEADAGGAEAGAGGAGAAAGGAGAAAGGGGAAAGGGGAANPGWNEVVRRNNKGKQKPKTIQGNNRMTVAAGAVRPVDFWIGGTDPRSTPELIKDILIKVARTMPAGMELGCELEIQNVALLTKPGEGNKFYSKSWQVTVEEKFREHMSRAESIPAGWRTRRFYPPRQKRAPLNPLEAQAGIVQQAQAQATAQLKPGDTGYVPVGLGAPSRT